MRDYPEEFDGPDYCEVCGLDIAHRETECKCPECPGCSESGKLECLGKPGHLPAREYDGETIKTLSDLCEWAGADAPRGLNRRLYKDTGCGASISVRPSVGWEHPGVERGWIHNGSKAWDDLKITVPILGFTIQIIIEGSDATVDSDEFTLPAKVKTVDVWVAEMESRSQEIYEDL